MKHADGLFDGPVLVWYHLYLIPFRYLRYMYVIHILFFLIALLNTEVLSHPWYHDLWEFHENHVQLMLGHLCKKRAVLSLSIIHLTKATL